jgi:PKD repeat protein
VPPVTDPDIWYSYRDNNPANPLGTPCLAYYAPTPGPIAPGSTTECPRLFPELYTGGVGPHGATKYHYDPANPNPKKFPPYYDDSVIIGEWTQDTMREVKLDDQNRVFKINSFLECGSRSNAAAGRFLFECDNPMDMQWGADGAFYLLTYGNGFNVISPDAGMYKWEYVKGKRPPKAVINTDRTDGPSPLTVNFTSTGSLDEDPGDSIRFEWDFGDGSPISTEPNPTHTYTQRGRFTAVLTVFDSSGEKTSTSTLITSGNTSPTVTVTAPLDGGLFSFGDKLEFKVTVTDPEDPSISCDDIKVMFVLGHDTHGHELQSTTGCRGFLQTDANDASHGGNVFGVISASYTDKGAAGGVPPLTTVSQNQVRQKRQEVEHVVNQSGTSTGTNTDGGAGVHRSSLANNDWIQLNGPFNLHQIDSVTIRYADNANGRTAGSPLGAIEVRTGSQTGPLVTTLELTSTGGNTVWNSLEFPIALEGKHELFFVFRSVTGGANGSMFLLNWAEFGGNGVTVVETTAPGDVGGNVPATLSLSLGAPASFGAFTPGVARDYFATTAANVISTAGDAALSVTDPSPNHTGKLVNGTFALAQTLQAGVGGTYGPIPQTIKTWDSPVSNDPVTIGFKQSIGANEPLRTGTYSKTLTFTLSTTNP